MLKLIGIHYLPVSVKAAAAAPRPSTIDVTFEPITAKGAYDKQIAIFVRDQSGAIVNEIPVLEYNWTGPAGPNGSTAVTSLYGGQDTFTVTVESGWSYGLRMRVWPDLNLQGSRAVEPTDYYSDINANHIQRSGDCTSEETNNWEDTGDFDYLDFIYKMRCTSAAASTQGAHLIQ